MSAAPARDPDVPAPRPVDGTGALPAVASQIRPALVLREADARRLLEGARREDVTRCGFFRAGPSGVQVWSAPFDGEHGTPGSAVHLGSVDWSYDTPNRHYITVYRAYVTAAGVAAGESTITVLGRVLALARLTFEGETAPIPPPPPRDPFRARSAYRG